MNVIRALKNVKGLDDYVSITEELLGNIANFTLELNNINIIITTVRVLKSIQSIEVQYFHKYNEFGAAAKLFELLLNVPTLKKGSAFGKELVCVVQYWLSSVRKFLIHKNEHWWKFLRNLLDFIQKLCLKHSTIHSYLVEHTGECLLDLATQGKPSTDQRYQILQCFNQFCSLVPRELRNALKDGYDKYFTKLAAWLPRCGDLLVQYEVLQTLLRWLLPRHELRARRAAAARWLPAPLYPPRAVQVFLDKTWLNVVADARLFLNAINEASDNVVSVLVDKFLVGSVSLLSVNTSREHWLDLNTESRSMSMMVNPMLHKTLNVPYPGSTVCHALVVTEDNTTSVHMSSGPHGTIISLKVIDSLQIFPAKVLENKDTVKVYIYSLTNVQRIDKALRTIFDTKYQVLKNDDAALMDLSQNSSRIVMDYISEEETRFSNPPEILRRKLLEQRAAADNSPSSTSTTSLLMLTEKLKNFPEFVYDKEISSCTVRTAPGLSTVPEVSEPSSNSSMSKSDPSGMNNSEQNSKNYSQNTKEGKDKNDVNAISKLDMLKQLTIEALQYSRTNAPKHNDVTHEICPNVTTRSRRRCDKRKYTVTSDSVDDSNTEFVENTPAVNINTTIINRKPTFMPIYKDLVNNSRDSGFYKTTFINEAVETFFFEQFAEDGNDNVTRKLNHSHSDWQSAAFSETSLDFNYQEVVDCLNFIVDNVCENLHQNLSQNSNQSNNLDISEIEAGPRNILLGEPTNSMGKEKKISNNKAKAKAKTTPVFQLRFKNIKKQTKNKKLDLNSIPKKPPIVEEERSRKDSDGTMTADLETPLSKRKRKLYSSKDDHLISKRTGIHVSETEDDNSILTSCKPADKSPVPTATPYKEIEKIRKKAAIRLRSRKSTVVSPKTKITNDLFDLIKNTVENNENITLVEKGAMYNFSSSSEDDGDFKKTVTPHNTTSVKSMPLKRGQNKPKSAAKDDLNRDTQINKRTRSKQQIVKRSLIAEPIRELIDERMREDTTEVLNSSLIKEYNMEEMNTELEPAHKIPRMEIIPDDKEYEMVTAPVMKKTKKQTKNADKRAKKGKKTVENKLVITTNSGDDDNKTISPLPGLEIEIQRVNEPDESIVKLDKLNNKREGDLVTIDLTKTLLSELEQVNNSPSRLNISGELIESITSPSSVSKTSMNKQPLVVLERIDIEYLKSRSTVGKCPETAQAVRNPRRVRSSTSSSVNKTSMNKQPLVVCDRIDKQSLKSISAMGKYPKTAHAVTDTERVRSSTSSSVSKTSMNKQPLVVCDRISLKSISTVGKCPITAHGEIDESPPQIKEIDRTIIARDLVTEEFSAKVVDFYNRLANDCNVSSDDKHPKAIDGAGKPDSSPHTGSNNSTNAKPQKSPSVTIARLSQSEIENYLLPFRNPVFDSASTSISERSTRISNKKPNDKSTKVRKSIISPIIIDETMFNKKNTSTDEEQASVNNTCEPDKSPCDPIRYDLRKFGKTYSVKDKILSSNNSKAKEGDGGNTSAAKKRKFEKKETTTCSSEALPSSSSVDDWLCRNENRSQSGREEVNDDLLSSILEKLDTTLYENRQNARSLLAKVIAQTRSLLEAKAIEHRQLVLQTVLGMDQTLAKVLAQTWSQLQARVNEHREMVLQKVSGLDQTIKEQDESLFEGFQTQIRDIFHDWVRKEHDLVALVREDIQAATNRTKNKDH